MTVKSLSIDVILGNFGLSNHLPKFSYCYLFSFYENLSFPELRSDLWYGKICLFMFTLGFESGANEG